ncbi:MAG: hypothetical protein EOP85_12880, partial [Verrucomicrobiaceae bacterium]
MKHDPTELPEPERAHLTKNRSIWQRAGGGALAVSVVFHVVLLAIGIVWILKVIPPLDEDAGFVSSSGGQVQSTQEQTKHRLQMVHPDLTRLVATNTTGTIRLHDAAMPSPVKSLGTLTGDGLSNGPGAGRQKDPAFGKGNSLVVANGGPGTTFFGTPHRDRSALTGSFHDLKQTSNGEPTGMTDDEFRKEVAEIVRRGFKEGTLDKYYKARRQLFQTRFHIPFMPAEAAPAAFECGKEVLPGRWVAVYRGMARAPKTGKFRFVGCGDDLLVVRFNNRPVFDYGYTLASTGTHLFRRSADVDGTNNLPQLTKEIRRRSPMKMPIGLYKYEQTPKYNEDVGGMAQGAIFHVEEGKAYPVEILIGEIPGGFFSVSLLIEEIGAEYRKDPMGSPILPLFRLARGSSEEPVKGEALPF